MNGAAAVTGSTARVLAVLSLLAGTKAGGSPAPYGGTGTVHRTAPLHKASSCFCLVSAHHYYIAQYYLNYIGKYYLFCHLIHSKGRTHLHLPCTSAAPLGLIALKLSQVGLLKPFQKLFCTLFAWGLLLQGELTDLTPFLTYSNGMAYKIMKLYFFII